MSTVKFIGIAVVLYGAFVMRLLRFRKKWSKPDTRGRKP